MYTRGTPAGHGDLSAAVVSTGASVVGCGGDSVGGASVCGASVGGASVGGASVFGDVPVGGRVPPTHSGTLI